MVYLKINLKDSVKGVRPLNSPPPLLVSFLNTTGVCILQPIINDLYICIHSNMTISDLDVISYMTL